MLVRETDVGGGFCLRDVNADDKEMILRWRNSDEVSSYMYTDHRITEAEHENWFRAAMSDPRRRHWIIMCDREAVGLVNLYDIDEKNRRCFWAFYIASRNVRGKGTGSLVEYEIMRHVFEDMAFNKLCCEVLSFNQTVIDMHMSFGFRQEGVYRWHVLKGGEFVDVVALAMLKSEWNEGKTRIEETLRARGLIQGGSK